MNIIASIQKKLPKFAYRFEEQVEKEFLKAYIERSLVVIRIGFFLGIFLYGIFGVLDIWIVPETKSIAWFIRFAIVIPVLILSIIISFTDFFKRHNQILLTISSAIVGLGIVAMISYSNPSELGYKYYYSGLILVLIWIYTFIRLRFWNSLIAGLIITLGYELVAVFVQHLTHGDLRSENMLVFINNNFFFISANILGAFASYHIEKLHRSDFRQKRTIMLQNNELQDINATKDKLFSIIAHDLKNPFASLISSSELLCIYLNDNNIEKSKAKAQMIFDASKNGFSLLQNLLEWAQSQLGKIKFTPIDIQLCDLVNRTIQYSQDQAVSKSIKISNEVPTDLQIVADISLLEFIMRNLVTNAIKFTLVGGNITIKAKSTSTETQISVKDNGVGMSKDIVEKLFRIDTRTSAKGTAGETGTGLGLLLCKEFIAKHSGNIFVESDLGKGSEFKFTIPL